MGFRNFPLHLGAFWTIEWALEKAQCRSPMLEPNAEPNAGAQYCESEPWGDLPGTFRIFLLFFNVLRFRIRSFLIKGSESTFAVFVIGLNHIFVAMAPIIWEGIGSGCAGSLIGLAVLPANFSVSFDW
ncbi:hypothetical protein SDJN02_25614, partial [Cucurbita argyrosperma subsp. argyrosperma]